MVRTLISVLGVLFLMGAGLTACGGDDDDDVAGDDDGQGDDDSGAGDDDSAGGDDDDTVQMPPDPTPITLQFAGAFADSLTFDQCACEQYPNPDYSNFRTTWRSSTGAHNAILIAEVLGQSFAGAGSYDQNTHMARIKLQNEAGEPYYNMYYAADPAAGDTFTITVDHIDEDVAWGRFDFSGLRDTSNVTTASPMPVQFWCDEVMD
jgi:hypothetical protein